MDSLRTGRLLLLALVFFLTAPVLSGCAAKDESDQLIDDLVLALQHGDWIAMQDISSPALLNDIDEPTFRMMARTTQKLGRFEDRTMQQISTNSNTGTSAHYVLDFAAGEVDLDIRVAGGQIIGFEMHGATVQNAIAEVNAEGP